MDPNVNPVHVSNVLIIVPPFAGIEYPLPGAHLLQVCCRRSGLEAKILYSNLLYTGIIEPQLYAAINSFQASNSLGERLFAASAFDVPSLGRNKDKLPDSCGLPEKIWLLNRDDFPRFIPGLLEPFKEWSNSIDWVGLESLTAGWVRSIAGQIVRTGFRIVGCTTTLGSLTASAALLRHIKRMAPDIVTIIGGCLCEAEMAEGLLSLDCGIDYVFSGEGEISFPLFVKNILAGNLPEEKIIHGEAVNRLDAIPLPDYREYFRQRDEAGIKPSSPSLNVKLPYETSRGCWWGKCTFCGLNGKKISYRRKSPEKVIGDLERLTALYPGFPIFMTDCIMPRNYFKTLIPQIQKTLSSIRIEYEMKANMKLEQVIALKKSGFSPLHAGIESLSPSILKRMQKGVTAGENIALLRYARSVSLDLKWYLLFGFPGEEMSDYEELLALLPLICHLQPPVKLNPLRIARFSPYQTAPEKFGISRLRPAELLEDVVPPGQSLENLCTCFTGDYKTLSQQNPAAAAALWKAVESWQAKWNVYHVASLEFLLPSLHLERCVDGGFVLHDSRGLPGLPEKTIVDWEQAGFLLTARSGDTGNGFQWALDAGLGVYMDSMFIPLATAEPELLLEFERDFS